MLADRPRSAASHVRNSSTSSGGSAARVRLDGGSAAGWRRASGEADDRLGVGQLARGDQRRHVGERRSARSSCAPPRCPAVEARTSVEVGGEEDVASARRRSPGELWNSASFIEPAGPVADLLGQLAVARSPRAARRRRRACRPGSRAARRRARPGTGAPARPCRRRTSGTTDTAPGMVDDVALERLAVGPAKVPTASEMTCPGRSRCSPTRRNGLTARRRDAGAGTVSRRDAGSRSSWMRCGLRPSARPSAAAMKLRNSGAGRSGGS